MASGSHVEGSPLLFAQRVHEIADLLASIGDPVWVGDVSAAALLRFDEFELRPPYHLVVPRGRNVSRIGHVVHTVVELPLIDRSTAFGLPVTSATRTIVDLARSEPIDRLTVAIDSATRDRLTTEDFLHRRLVALRGRGRAGTSVLLDAIRGIEVTRGGHSWLERRFLELCAANATPRPLTQHVVGRGGQRLVRVDCRFPGTRVVVELLGYAFHRTTAQLTNDAERMNRMLLDGLVPLQFTYTQVVEDPAGVIDLLREALAAA